MVVAGEVSKRVGDDVVRAAVLEERRETHAGCPMCGGRRQVVTVINGRLALRPCEWFGCGGRAHEHAGFWRPVKGWPAVAGGEW